VKRGAFAEFGFPNFCLGGKIAPFDFAHIGQIFFNFYLADMSNIKGLWLEKLGIRGKVFSQKEAPNP
jgi:hypothetical protein